MNYFVFALRNLKRKGVRSWLTLLGIFVGVMAVVALISLGNALQVAVTSQFGVAQTEIISVQASGVAFGPPGSGAVTPLDVSDVEAIRKLSSVERAVRRNIASGKLEYNDRVVFGSATNVPDGENSRPGLRRPGTAPGRPRPSGHGCPLPPGPAGRW